MTQISYSSSLHTSSRPLTYDTDLSSSSLHTSWRPLTYDTDLSSSSMHTSSRPLTYDTDSVFLELAHFITSTHIWHRFRPPRACTPHHVHSHMTQISSSSSLLTSSRSAAMAEAPTGRHMWVMWATRSCKCTQTHTHWHTDTHDML
jgi:hypothetical protein